MYVAEGINDESACRSLRRHMSQNLKLCIALTALLAALGAVGWLAPNPATSRQRATLRMCAFCPEPPRCHHLHAVRHDRSDAIADGGAG